MFVSIDAMMPGSLEPAFRSLLALQTYGIGAPLTRREQRNFVTPAAVALTAIAKMHQACFVFTSISTPKVDTAFIRKHLENLGLSDMASQVAENWSTSTDLFTSRTEEIRNWLHLHASLYETYAIIDTAVSAHELMSSDLSEHVIIVDSEIQDYVELSKQASKALTGGMAHA